MPASEGGTALAPGRERAILALLLVAAFALRAWGTFQGLPQVYHPDEPGIVERALRMVDEADPSPHFFHYPSLWFYIQAVVGGSARALARAAGADALTVQGAVYLAGRLASALLGSATVLLAWLAARRVWGAVAGLGAGVAVAFSFLHVQHSQYATTDVPAAFCTALCLWLALRAFTGAGRHGFVWAGAAAGLAAATKYNAGLCLVAVLALWLATVRSRKEILSWTPVLACLASGLVFLGITPWLLFEEKALEEGLFLQWNHYRGDHHGFDGDHNWAFYLSSIFRSALGPGASLLALGGAAVLARRRWRLFLALAAFPALYYLLLAGVRVRFERNLLPLLPCLAVFAGFGLKELAAWSAAPSRTPSMRWFTGVLATSLLVAWPAWLALRYDWIVTRPDTRARAAAWIEETIQPGASFCVELYTPELSEEKYRVAADWSLCAEGLRDIAEGDCRFAVASSRMYGRYLDDPEAHPEMAGCYRFVFERWPLLREFSGREVAEHDPVIRVLHIPRD